ncbi:MAG: hypothetical protein FJW39_21365 [Acidobacteria bacterium]|nr:hypothetical protein [Acidobacteriota bacterium]
MKARRTLIVTVGMSAITNSDLGKAGGQDNKRLLKDVAAFLKRRDGAKRTVEANPDLFADLVIAHRRFWAQPSEYRWNPKHARQTSAELLSTSNLLQSGWFKPDRTVLLSAGTPEGKFAVEVNLNMMRHFLESRLSVAEMPGFDPPFSDPVDKIEDLVELKLAALNDDRCCPPSARWPHTKGGIPPTSLKAVRRSCIWSWSPAGGRRFAQNG